MFLFSARPPKAADRAKPGPGQESESHPPNYYFPPEDVNMDMVKLVEGSSFCEWKGAASYYDIEVAGDKFPRSAWSYPNPTSLGNQQFAPIKNYLCFYCRFEKCIVDGEVATPQPGQFYGGWITKDILGPFKGAQGTMGW